MIVMTSNLRIAACQFPVSSDIASNTKYICRFMKKASSAEAHVIHFPETALSGYGRIDLTQTNSDIWKQLEYHTNKIKNLANHLGLWVVLGSCRKIIRSVKPANCTIVISDSGDLAGIYDKQKLSQPEKEWYSPGKGYLVLTINGINCGFLICYESCFPNLFKFYRKNDVQLIFHSCYNVSRKPKPDMRELALAQIRTRAADNLMWISGSNSSARYSFSTACIVRPDGSIRKMRRYSAGILLHDFPDTKLGWTYDNRE